MDLQISPSAFASAKKKYPLSTFLGEFWPVYLSVALILSYCLSEGLVGPYEIVSVMLVAPLVNYLVYVAYIIVQKDEILGRQA